MSEPIVIQLPTRIDLAAAQDIVARVRSALRNGKNHIVLQFSSGSSLCSSEFLGYLVAVGKHVQTANGRLELRGVTPENQRIIAMLHLDQQMSVDPGQGGPQ